MEDKVHCDISFNNILLQEEYKKEQETWPESKTISSCDKIHKTFNCQKGLVINFDYATLLLHLINTAHAEDDEDAAEATKAAGNARDTNKGPNECDVPQSDFYPHIADDLP